MFASADIQDKNSNAENPSISSDDDQSTEEKCRVLPKANSTNHFVEWSHLQILSELPKDRVFHCSEDFFKLRIGPDYNSNKMKATSPKSIMELVGCDLYSTSSNLTNIGSRVELPDEWIVETHGSGVPPVFILNFFIPTDCSLRTIFANVFSNMTDGVGVSIAFYFRLTKETVEALKDESTASGATRLFADYCRNAPELDDDDDSPYKGRFKVICNTLNLDKLGVPSFIQSYNSKPFLVRQGGKLHRGENNRYIEMDVNFFTYGSIFRRAVGEMLPRYEFVEICVGFCIESRSDEEMPETLIGACKLNYPKYSNFKKWNDFFELKSRSSSRES